MHVQHQMRFTILIAVALIGATEAWGDPRSGHDSKSSAAGGRGGGVAGKLREYPVPTQPPASGMSSNPIAIATASRLTPGQWQALTGKTRWFAGDEGPIRQQILAVDRLARDERRLVKQLTFKALHPKTGRLRRSGDPPRMQLKDGTLLPRMIEVQAIRLTLKSGRVHTAFVTSGDWAGVSSEAFNKGHHGLLRSSRISRQDPLVRIQIFHTHPLTGALSTGDMALASAVNRLYKDSHVNVPVDIYAISPIADSPADTARVIFRGRVGAQP